MPNKRYPTRIDVDLVIPTIIIGLLAGLIISRWLHRPVSIIWDNGFLIVTGFLCVVAAKISLFRRGIWRSWGPRMMTRGWSCSYKIGYVLMATGYFTDPVILFRNEVAAFKNHEAIPQRLASFTTLASMIDSGVSLLASG